MRRSIKKVVRYEIGAFSTLALILEIFILLSCSGGVYCYYIPGFVFVVITVSSTVYFLLMNVIFRGFMSLRSLFWGFQFAFVLGYLLLLYFGYETFVA
jgi:hypothetical protein